MSIYRLILACLPPFRWSYGIVLWELITLGKFCSDTEPLWFNLVLCWLSCQSFMPLWTPLQTLMNASKVYWKKKNYTQKKIAQLNIDFLREPFCKFSPNPETFLMNKYYLALSWTCAIHFLREDAFVLFNCRLLLWPGTSPYPGVSGRDIQKLLRNGYRMEKSENCSQQV